MRPFFHFRLLYLFLVLFQASLKSQVNLLSDTSSQRKRSQVENLVFEGAGIKGVAYSGVIKELERTGIISNVKRVCGTSAGAITSLMVSIGYSSSEIYQIISETKFQKFNDGQFIFLGGFKRLSKRYGWYKGKAFTKWLEQIIEQKTGNKDITFEQLKGSGFKELYVTATCLNKQKLVVFSSETYPKMKVKDAVRISMSIPLYFEAVFIDSLGNVFEHPKNSQDLDVMVDGGIIGNYPIFVFDSIINGVRIPNFRTIGVRIDTENQIENDLKNQSLAPLDIQNFSDFMKAFYLIVIENLNRNALIKEDWERTISVSSVGIGPKIKRLSLEQKTALMESGERYTRDFFEKKKQ
jgi:NTE family protein